ncbi:MAG: stress response translation initiation inhibitor YciH [Cellvibrionales bacterium]|nr:MAG: stress response translation initiation inhibitor YciH [Cellvibrionales bacterium]
MKKNSKLVYSTDRGRIKPSIDPGANSQEGDGIVRIRRETSGRKGGAVTTLNGINGTNAELKALAKKLKHLCGSGGTLKNGVIEIQGDHREKIAAALGEAGFTVKFAGG